jgi:hypothetical protein
MISLPEAAAHYASRGLHVFPLRPRDKKPLTQHGCHDATTDAATVCAWWKRWPDANIGCACWLSGLVVVDLDGERGMASWHALAGRLGLTVATRTAITGGGGRHLFFRAPAGARIGNSAGKLGPGIDIRADGGYVVLPPSVHPSGGVYRWADELRSCLASRAGGIADGPA